MEPEVKDEEVSDFFESKLNRQLVLSFYITAMVAFGVCALLMIPFGFVKGLLLFLGAMIGSLFVHGAIFIHNEILDWVNKDDPYRRSRY